MKQMHYKYNGMMMRKGRAPKVKAKLETHFTGHFVQEKKISSDDINRVQN